METIPLKLNSVQTASFLYKNVKHSCIVAGRGLGKSSEQALKWHRNIHAFPLGNSIVTGQSYVQLLTRTLPPLFSFLHKLGYKKDVDYFIGRFPDKKLKWVLPNEHPFKAEKYVMFATPKGVHGFVLSSQDREGDARGGNYDFSFTDESLLIDKEKYDMEVGPTIRANKVPFKDVPFHWGSHHSTTMPYDSSGKWLLDMANYYMDDYKIDILSIWEQIVNLQYDMLQMINPEEIKLQWNEILRLKRMITPRPSKDGKTLFIIGNSFDNIENLPDDYVKESFNKMSRQIFLIEILNMIIRVNGEPYFTSFEFKKHVKMDTYDYLFIDNHTQTTNFDFSKISVPDCRYDADCIKSEPLFISFDLGGNLVTMLVSQYEHSKSKLRILKEFYAKPGKGILIDTLLQQFIEYYKFMQNRLVYFVRDRYGDNKGPNFSLNANQQIIEILKKSNFETTHMVHKKREPPAYDKYLLINNILQYGSKGNFFDVQINGNNCKYMRISIQNTRVKQKGNDFSMDKSSETNKSIDQLEATHFADNFCKLLWTVQNEYKAEEKLFIAPRI